jgi:peptidoglycan hydrolase-like protein with peptidoglycan-binding domain
MWEFRPFDPAGFRAPARKVTRVFLHCTDSDNAALAGVGLAEEVNRWHLANGWAGIGYNFVVDKAGVVVTGRPLELTPAAQLGEVPLVEPAMVHMGNVATIAISTHGSKDFTPESLAATHALMVAIDSVYFGLGTPVTFHGHCEIDPRPCPVYPYRQVHSLDELGRLKSVEPRASIGIVAPAAASRDWPKLPINDPPPPPVGARDLFEGCHGPDVEAVQRKLGIVPVDGAFGPQTFRVIADWQHAIGLVSDGIIGPASRKALGLN